MSEPSSSKDSAYDDIPYESHPFAQSHPNRLFTLGTLFGLKPTPVQKCRVLELGCAAGGNLIPMADYLPESQFVGVDNSERQIADGLGTVKQLGLENVILKQASILDVDAAYGKFDYIIAHGVYSWVPEDVRAKILEICANQLNPQGIAYLSYNTYPGWHMRGMIRDMMRYHASRFSKPKERIQQARALLKFLAQSVNRTDPRLPEAMQNLAAPLDALMSAKLDATQHAAKIEQVKQAAGDFAQLFPLDAIRRDIDQLAGAAELPKAAASVRGRLNEIAALIQKEGAYPQLLKQEADSIQNQADHYLFHEHLAEVNAPVYFHDFIDKAKARGLQYLGEARVGTMVTANFGAEVEKTLRALASDQIQAEQYMDFLRNRMFRETLLCSDKHTVGWVVNPESMRSLHVSSAAKPVVPEGTTELNLANDDGVTFRSPAGLSISTNRPLLKIALHLMSLAYPASIPFETLRKQARETLSGDPNSPRTIAEDTAHLATGLLNCYMGTDLIELFGMPISFARDPGDYPTALPLARIHAKKSGLIANRRHEVVRLNELDRHLIPMLDGSNDRAALVEKLVTVARAGEITVRQHDVPVSEPIALKSALESIIDPALKNIARMGVLVG